MRECLLRGILGKGGEKMKKKIVSMLLAVLLMAGVGLPACADAGNGFSKVTLTELSSGYGPGKADLDRVGGKKIKYPRQESFYLREYLFGEVARKKAIAYINPNASDVMADNNTFTVPQGEAVTALAQSSGYMCVIFPGLDRAGWIDRSDLDLYVYFVPQNGVRPSEADLDYLQADCKYPAKSTYYLDQYIKTSMKQGTGLVYLNPNAGNVTSDSNTFDVKKGEEVIIIAETKNLACCIFPNMSRAGWVEFVYLSRH